MLHIDSSKMQPFDIGLHKSNQESNQRCKLRSEIEIILVFLMWWFLFVHDISKGHTFCCFRLTLSSSFRPFDSFPNLYLWEVFSLSRSLAVCVCVCVCVRIVCVCACEFNRQDITHRRAVRELAKCRSALFSFWMWIITSAYSGQLYLENIFRLRLIDNMTHTNPVNEIKTTTKPNHYFIQ